MTCNLGIVDRAVRTTIGLVIAGSGILYGSWLGLLAVVPLGTAILGYCPSYKPFDWSTREEKR